MDEMEAIATRRGSDVLSVLMYSEHRLIHYCLGAHALSTLLNELDGVDNAESAPAGSKVFLHPRTLHSYRQSAHHVHITAMGHSLGGTLVEDSASSDKQIPCNKGTSLHDVVCKRRKPSQINYRNTRDVFSLGPYVAWCKDGASLWAV
jgi:hypothetical protein